ncbi:MAG TPA: class I SAM-dependent methyltransferase [Sphingomicrobium sp.]
MRATDIQFAGSIPEMYDRYMVPLLVRPYAELVAERARILRPKRILETAAGTGVLTDALHRAVPDAAIVATDLNPPMLEEAARRVADGNVHFQPADALDLPFAEASFDLVACQFGVMFFPDKVRGNAEAFRVLQAGGNYLLVIWDSVDRNLATKVAGRAVADLFPDDPTAFYNRIPFRYFHTDEIKADLRAAGFADIAVDTIELRSRAPTAREVAIALTQATPMRNEIEQHGPDALERATAAAEIALRQFEGPGGFDAPMSAHLVTASK